MRHPPDRGSDRTGRSGDAGAPAGPRRLVPFVQAGPPAVASGSPHWRTRMRGDRGRGLRAEEGRRATAPRLWPVALAGAYDAVGHAVVAPVLPALGRKAGASPLATSAIFAGSSVGMCAGFALAALMVRRWGPRRTLLAGVMAHV